MSMTLDEMKLAVCEKLPELIYNAWSETGQPWCWLNSGKEINWHTEGLQVCHEAEKLLKFGQVEDYLGYLHILKGGSFNRAFASYEQRLEALCRVWFPERFK